MVRIFVKRDSTSWGYDSTSKSSDFFCRTVVVVIFGPLQIKFKIGLVEGHPLFFEHRFSRCESYTCREYKHIVFYNFLQKKYIVVQQVVVQYTPVVTIWNTHVCVYFLV